MYDKRRYKRFKLNDREVNGKMVLATEVKIIDISVSGISVKTNRRLNIDSDCTIKLEGRKTISLGGMLIECLRNFEIESRIPMEMFIHEDSPLKFVGRVASSRVIDKEGQKHNIGIEFLDLTEKDREVIDSFIDNYAMAETETGNAPETTAVKSGDENTVPYNNFMNPID